MANRLEVPTHATLLNYDTKLDARARRDLAVHKRELLDRLTHVGATIQERGTYPFRSGATRAILSEALEDDLQSGDSSSWIIDISCLTKVQTVAVGEWLVENSRLLGPVNVRLAYTAARQYGAQASIYGLGHRYHDVIARPLGSGVPADYSGSSVSVLALLGHEGARLLLAMSTFVVARGCYVLADNGRGAQATAKTENETLLRDIELGLYGASEIVTTNTFDTLSANAEVARSVSRFPAEERVVLLPFGPKPLVLASVILLMASEAANVWMCCPVSGSYSAGHSVGIGGTRFWRLNAHAAALDDAGE